MSDDGQSTDVTDRSEALGTAEELGVAVFEGVDPSEVTIYADGSHEGKVKRKWRDETVECLTDNQNYPVVGIFCPCGHYLRDKHLHHHEPRQTVRCDGAIADIEEPEPQSVPEAETEQTTLVAATDGGNARCVEPDSDQSSGGDGDA